MKQLIKGHRYLIKNNLGYQLSPICIFIIEVSITSYKYKIESGGELWCTKEDFERNYFLIEDLGIPNPIKISEPKVDIYPPYKEVKLTKEPKTLQDWLDDMVKKDKEKKDQQTKFDIETYPIWVTKWND